MVWIQAFLNHPWVIEAIYLWIAAAAVVVIASVVHYVIDTRDRDALKQRIETQRTKQQPEQRD